MQYGASIVILVGGIETALRVPGSAPGSTVTAALASGTRARGTGPIRPGRPGERTRRRSFKGRRPRSARTSPDLRVAHLRTHALMWRPE